MNNTKGITKIIIDYTPCYGNGSILTITDTYISCEYKNKDSRSLIWLYQSKSYEFRGVYAKITEFVEKHLEPTQKKIKRINTKF